MRDVRDQLVRWYLEGTFQSRTDEADWCRHIFRESNKAANTHVYWLMDNDDYGPGAQWESSCSPRKIAEITSHLDVF